MPSFNSILLTQLKQYQDRPVILACSGGVDSLVLLHQVAALLSSKQLLSDVTVCYVNHGLSAHADSWQHFVEQQCQELSLNFVAKQVKLNKTHANGLEAQARDARYLALKSLAGEQGVVVTAHHLDDQSETLLLALKRGAGLKGLAAMSCHGELVIKQEKLKICRPFLLVSRQQIVAKAEQLGLSWIEDESNQDCQFDRNFIRQQVMPVLKARWPSIATTIARSAEHCQDAQRLIDEIAQQDLALCQLAVGQVSIPKLLALSSSRFNYVIRYFLAQSGYLMPSSAQLAQIKQQLAAEPDKSPEIKLANAWLRRYKDALYLTGELADISAWQQLIEVNDLQQGMTIELPDGVGELQLTSSQPSSSSILVDNKLVEFSLPESAAKLSIMFSHDNPRCHPDYRQHSRSLKKIWQELNIPPWQRKRIPLVFADGQLVAALGHFVCQPYLAKIHLQKVSVVYKARS